MSEFDYQKDADGIVTITMDMQGPVNSMSPAFLPLLDETVSKLEAEGDLKGVILTSAKSTFFAGGDLKTLVQASPIIQRNFSTTLRRLKRFSAAWRSCQCRLWRPSTAPLWVAA